jgi:hypothetical protein
MRKAPALYRELKEQGKLTAYLREQAGQINSQVVTAMRETRLRQGWDRQDLTLPEMAGRLAAAQSSAMESALDEALQFPQPETSSPSPG